MQTREKWANDPVLCMAEAAVDMCMGMRIDMCIGMCMDVRMDMCIDMRVDMRIDMRTGVNRYALDIYREAQTGTTPCV